MAGKPKPSFWIVVFLIVIGLIVYSLYNAGIFRPGQPEPPGPVTSPVKPKPPEPPKPKYSGEVVVTIASSVTKQKWMIEMANEFNAMDKKTSRDSKIIVDPGKKGVLSGGSMLEVLDGRLKPVVWSPGAVSWVEQFREKWKERTNQSAISQDCQPCVYSPIGIAMWRPMAEALGWPDKPVGFKTIVELAADPKGWARYGHPEWGKFQIGHPHPLYSSAGMLFLSAFSYGISGKTAELSAADIYAPDVKAAFEKLAQNTAKYGMISTNLLSMMVEHGPSFLHAVSAFEEGTVRLNLERAGELRFPVAFIFPEEGTFWSSHPYCIMDKADWVSEDQAEAAQMFLDFLLERPQQEAAARNLLRPLDSSIPILSPLDLEHGTDPRITTETVPPLAIPSSEVSSAIIDMFMITKRKATVMVLLDVSGSMHGEKIRSATRATAEFLKRFDPNDVVGVTTFNHNISLLSPLTLVKNVRETLPDKVENLFANGGTSLYDSVAHCLKIMGERKQKNEEAGIKRLYGIVLLSDGADSNSSITENQLFATILPAQPESEGIKIFPIAFGAEANKIILGRMADRTGGSMYSANPASIEKIYLNISAEQ